ncbi:MAG: ABC transporter ATP-binding protein [Oscillospiraceae bacterium]|nr:ABC transporter ATP-binding protein [Oscillospiraceae bacterium]MBQ9981457.1 ABC transporter ATP-binding protein [Oscillospiraceae bacterium]
MLRFENVIKGYGNKKALNNLNVSFEKGKVYALVGPNGSGKSTMMKIAAGLVKPTKGSCTYDSQNIGAYSKSKIAYMCTEPFYYDYMRISDVEKYYADFFEDFNRDKFRNLLQFMELDASMKVKALSSGMAAKLKISATLAREAEVIMLDEPLNGIDLLGRDQIINAVIKATNPGSTFIISSHLFDELENIVDNVVMVKNGNVVLEGELEDIRAQYGKSISDLYREIYGSNDGLSDEIWGK